MAYRYFSTQRRSFIVADTPGHEQYTRNMATGASNADLAVILVDASRGILPQTRRHSMICSMFGIRHVTLAVNKMDAVGYDRARFDAIATEYSDFARRLTFESVVPIPLSARRGDNVTARGDAMTWHDGPTLLAHLETVPTDVGRADRPMRFPVQWVNRPDASFRGYAGTVAGGRMRPGDVVSAADHTVVSRIARIVTADGDLEDAAAGDAVTVVLADPVDLARGDMLASPAAPPHFADQFAAHVVWFGAAPLIPHRSYIMRIGTRWVPASVTSIRHRLSIEDLQPIAAHTLGCNEIGVCHFSISSPVSFDAYADNRETGAFILVDRDDNRTVAAGTILFPLRRAGNIRRETLSVDKAARSAMKGQKACAIWFTGLPASGKSTIAKRVEAALHRMQRHTYMLDGDNLRHGLNRDLGFTEADRAENVRRVGETAKLFVDAGLIAICAFVSPYRADRLGVRELLEPDEFIEVFVDTPLEECIRRDPKGLYAKAARGELANFTGIGAPYEAPERPDLVLSTLEATADELAERVIAELLKRERSV